MEWHKLTKKNMPPVDNENSFLLWLGANEDGGFPVLGKRVQYDGKEPYIRYITPTGWQVLEESDFRGFLWAPIDPPEQAIRQRAKWESKCRKGDKA